MLFERSIMFPRKTYEERLGKIVAALDQSGLDGLLLNRTSNIAYLTGAVNSCSWMFITKEGKWVALVMDSDVEVYREESVVKDIRTFRDHDPFSLFKKVAEELGLTRGRIGLEFSRPGIFFKTFEILKFSLPPTVQFANGEMLIEELRAIKSEEEIEYMKKAARIAELGMDSAFKAVKPGLSEADLASEVELTIRRANGRVPVLNYIASGKRTCLAHHAPSNKKVENGDVVTLDIHAGYMGYCADLSRTIVCGDSDQADKIKQAYADMIKAEEQTIQECRNGVALKEIKKGFYQRMNEVRGLKFLLGPVLHGVGIVNHEMPYFQFPHNEKGYPEKLTSNMVLALSNIGLYFPHDWGVRVEDTILVTDDEPIYLTHFTKELVHV